MVFSSAIFLFVFFPLLLIVYFMPFHSRRYKNSILLLASLLFYWWGSPVFVFIMLFSIVVNWWLGMAIDQHRAYTKYYVFIACLYNLGILFIFKYLGFFSQNLAILFKNDSLIIEIALPIGISFFTFQMLSYVFDVAKKEAFCQKNVFDVALYVVMFPQLIAGPIVRYETVAKEIEERKENIDDFSDGICRFIQGLAKKVILANNLGVLVDLIFEGNINEISVLVAWIGAIAYTLQIFYDFSGYSDMAIGLGKIFGFHFLENFNFPYISKSISEFWRRWHISMGTWFRDYVYFPLGGSRVNSKWKLVRNLFVVWALTGLWHGANWTFIVWGILYFVLIGVEKFTGIEKRMGFVFSHIYTMFFVILGWVLFRADSLSDAGVYIKSMFGLNGNALISGGWNLLSQYGFFMILGIIFSFPISDLKIFKGKNPLVGEVAYVVAELVMLFFSIVYVVKGGYNPFIYFNF